MKRIVLPIALFSLALYNCSGEEQKKESVKETPKEEVIEEIVVEEVVEEAPSVGDFIEGTWAKIAQDCDENGNNCEETPDASDWVFTHDSVSLGRITQPYAVSGDTIYIADSPYMITSEMSDTIVLHGINANRYMKLVKR